MTISKKPLLEIDPYPDEFEYEDFVIALGELVKQRFKSGYVKCSAENMGWRNLPLLFILGFVQKGKKSSSTIKN